MTLNDLKAQLAKKADTIQFSDVMTLIESLYLYTPTAFQNGTISNTAEQNQGSCKILAFAQRNNFSQEETLALFGHYYFDDVLKQPDADNHGNIRAFMASGWAGVSFDGTPLTEK